MQAFMISTEISHLAFMPEIFCLYFERWCKPSSKWRLHTKVKMVNCIFGDQVRKQNFSSRAELWNRSQFTLRYAGLFSAFRIG